jgi:hypothetical protein
VNWRWRELALDRCFPTLATRGKTPQGWGTDFSVAQQVKSNERAENQVQMFGAILCLTRSEFRIRHQPVTELNERFGLLASFEEMEAGEDSATAELSNTDLHLRCERKLF